MSQLCPICCSPSELVFDLPSLPLTGVLVEIESLYKDPLLDNALMFCASCSHGFLANKFSYEILYGGTKQSVTSSSRLAREMNKVFESFIVDVCPNLNSKTVLEFGAGDLFLANRLKFLTHKYYAVEPSLSAHQADERMSLIGGGVLVEDAQRYIDTPIDIVIASHCLEHLPDPRSVVRSLAKLLPIDGLFLIEVPDFAPLISCSRFDLVFHQHHQYFTFASLSKLFASEGFGLRACITNPKGFGGGSLLASFGRGVGLNFDPTISKSVLLDSLGLFRASVSNLRQQVEMMTSVYKDRVFGWGASQLVPILAYHLKSDFSELAAIIDIDPIKSRYKYPNLKVPIVGPRDVDLTGCAILITALDYAEEIASNLPLGPKFVVQPFANVGF
jgi:SAM-dependent methyltransferase